MSNAREEVMIKAGSPKRTFLLCSLSEHWNRQRQVITECYVWPCTETSKEAMVNTRSNHISGFCQSHQQESTMRYCHSCDLSLCFKCFLEEKHLSHTIYDLEIVMDKTKAFYKIPKYNIDISVSQNLVNITVNGRFEPKIEDIRNHFLASISRNIRKPLFLEAPSHDTGKEIRVKIATNAPKTLSLSFKSKGEEDGMLDYSWGIACNQVNHFIVVDGGNHCIKIFERSGNYIKQFGKMGCHPGEFNTPTGVAVDPVGHIVIADSGNHRIQVFSSSGEFILMFGECGKHPGQFYYPTNVACNEQGQIIVSDTYNQRVQLFDYNGICLANFGLEDKLSSQSVFGLPRGVCFGPNNAVIVTDFLKNCLIVLDNNLKYRTTLGLQGIEEGQFNRPKGIVCNDEGRIAVVDSGNQRLQVFEHDGRFLWKMNIDMNKPNGITVTSDGKIAVIDGDGRVNVY